MFPLVQMYPYKYGFLYRFFQKYGFWDFCTDFFLKRPFLKVLLINYALLQILWVWCDMLRAVWWHMWKEVGIDTIDSIDTFFLFFYVRLRFRMMDNLFFVKKNLIQVSRVPWKDFLFFSGSSVFLKSNFSENFLKS